MPVTRPQAPSAFSGGNLELVVAGLSFPTSLAFDAKGTGYVAESGLAFAGAAPGGRIWRVADGEKQLVADGLRAPVNGLAFHRGALYVSEGGHPGRISRLELDGRRETILDQLPGPGNYHTNMAVFGPDGKLYFSQGAMTNSGVVGLDAYELGWLRRLPHAHDLPGYDIVLRNINFETSDPRNGGTTKTGAFAPFGSETKADQPVGSSLPCTAAIMRCQDDGTELELVAWGLRNAYGLGFVDARLLAIDQGYDDRGSRPVGNAPDLLYEIREGAWYGWPDFVGGDPITDERFVPARGPRPEFLLANHAQLPPPERPLLRFAPHASAVKFAVSPAGWLADALFGDEAPMTAPPGPREGRSVVRADVDAALVTPLIDSGLNRPIDVAFDRDGALLIVDFGEFEMTAKGVVAGAETGAVYRVRGIV